ncbi:MAG: heparinase II/III-family protein [Puniceicoccales bacterium]|jgi:hypothetical protein|nr:heparinase II/III-family protein [Puniceicoccales bacterium]
MNIFKSTLLALLLCVTALHAQTPPTHDLLSAKHPAEKIATLLIPRDKWTPFPRLENRDAWLAVDKATRDAYLANAEKHLDYKWPTVPATASLDFARIGSRAGYDNISFQKRRVLAGLLIGEILENKGRFLDAIVNGVWSICEESWWGSAAHLSRAKPFNGLADVTNPSVDLFAATTAEILAWTDYFLGEKFDVISPQIRKRITHEVRRRIFQPALTKHHWWMGDRKGGSAPNNWNPWICSNWLACALLLERDETARATHVAKILTVLDNFVNHYPQDGGCDEGVGYWNAAPGSLYDNIALLNLATHDAFSYVFADEKIKNMGKFIYRMQISERYMVNFADASPEAGVDGVLVYRYGKSIDDSTLSAFGAAYNFPPQARLWGTHLARGFFELFLLEEFRNAKRGFPFLADVWLPDLQVATARDKAGSADGFYFAAKGGNNGESHNHNDIGSFVLYYDGLPVLIDVGSGRYTAQTFSARRYEIWNMRSDSHNTPTINGVVQKDGGKFKATDTHFAATTGAVSFDLDIAAAYPPQAAVRSWRRTITLNRGKSLVVEDAPRFLKAGSFTEHLMTSYPVETDGTDAVIIRVKDRANKDKNAPVLSFRVKFIGAVGVRTVIEKVKLAGESDAAVQTRWGDDIHRINFVVDNAKSDGTYKIEVTKQ